MRFASTSAERERNRTQNGTKAKSKATKATKTKTTRTWKTGGGRRSGTGGHSSIFYPCGFVVFSMLAPICFNRDVTSSQREMTAAAKAKAKMNTQTKMSSHRAKYLSLRFVAFSGSGVCRHSRCTKHLSKSKATKAFYDHFLQKAATHK